MKIWLIPADAEENSNSIYIVTKCYHFIADGLSNLQMWSLMQDGGPEVSRGTNKVHYTNRPKYTLGETLSNFGESSAKSQEMIGEPTKPRKLLVDENVELSNTEQDFYISKEIDLNAVKTKAKSYGGTINDLLLAACA